MCDVVEVGEEGKMFFEDAGHEKIMLVGHEHRRRCRFQR